jgi:hypothetical protein
VAAAMKTRMGMRLVSIALLAGALCCGCAHKEAKQNDDKKGKVAAAGKQASANDPAKDKNRDENIIASPGPFDDLCGRVQTQMRDSGATDDDLDALRSYCGKAGRIYKTSGKDATSAIKAIEEECEAEKDSGVRLDCYNIRILEASTNNAN